MMRIVMLYRNRAITCCFSGYRPEKLPWGYNEADLRYIKLGDELRGVVETVYASGIRVFLCGMALGSDMLFCETALKFKEDHPDIVIEAALPCENQAAKWSEGNRSRYFKLLQQCDSEVYVSRQYTPDCMLRRNRYMVDQSSVLIAVFDGRLGGTMYTVTYAEANGLEIIQLKP
jgi:uncharacterized phage-like protein YoqJ